MQTTLDGFDSAAAVVVTVTPTLVGKLLSGDKLVEFRKVWPKARVRTIWFCEKGSQGRIALRAAVKEVLTIQAEEAWGQFGGVSGVNESDFFKYIDRKRDVHCLILQAIEIVHDTFVQDLGVMRPPQNYAYVDQ
ncbi:hypothetical protein [Burkholderia sp. BCC0097]|uniref:hypothetical protein n=1 Tax=Burkholderia sp. BCC0097 TaxID=2676289 RepID=UPI00158BB9EB|nr:hypothetical protein [Burkholderia sp. BCC0097]